MWLGEAVQRLYVLPEVTADKTTSSGQVGEDAGPMRPASSIHALHHGAHVDTREAGHHVPIPLENDISVAKAAIDVCWITSAVLGVVTRTSGQSNGECNDSTPLTRETVRHPNTMRWGRLKSSTAFPSRRNSKFMATTLATAATLPEDRVMPHDPHRYYDPPRTPSRRRSTSPWRLTRGLGTAWPVPERRWRGPVRRAFAVYCQATFPAVFPAVVASGGEP